MPAEIGAPSAYVDATGSFFFSGGLIEAHGFAQPSYVSFYFTYTNRIRFILLIG